MESFFKDACVVEGAQEILGAMQKYQGKFAVGMTRDKNLSPEWTAQTLMRQHTTMLALEYDNQVLKATLEAILLTLGDDTRDQIAQGVGEILKGQAAKMIEQAEAALEAAKTSIVLPSTGGLVTPP